MAPDAEFLLARTELSGEPWKEELFWIQAAEWADKMGAHIISSSLGYTYHRYFVRDLSGHSTPIAAAANIAARKGILVVNCMGNEGNSDWKYAVTPADADSVLSVGGIDPDTGIHINFSSFGPNMSGSLKPNVVASGKTLAASPKDWKTAYGTSFSTPLIAGFAACAWESFPNMHNMEIFDLIQRSAHLYPYYDFAHGYGIPKASGLFRNPSNDDTQGNINIEIIPDSGKISITIKDSDEVKVNPTSHYLYYNLRNSDNEIVRYGIYLANYDQAVLIDIPEDSGIAGIFVRFRDSYKDIKLD